MAECLFVSLQVTVYLKVLVIRWQPVQLVQERKILLGVLLRLLGHHHNQGEVIHAQGNVIQLVDIHQIDGVLESFCCCDHSIGTNGTSTPFCFCNGKYWLQKIFDAKF
jgi:hypothetical protein